MVKGTTPILNLQLLKRARGLGIFVMWNFLWDVPGDEVAWYGEVAEWLPLVSHLQAPNTLTPVRIDRFSPYHQRPEAYGLSLQPTAGLRYIYPLSDETLTELTYYFDDHSRPIERALRRVDPVAQHFAGLVREWMAAWGRVRSARDDAPEPPRLEKIEVRGGLEVIDTRAVAQERRVLLEGPEASVLELCDGAPDRAGLERSLELSPQQVDEALSALRARRLILELDHRILSLPTRPPRAPYIPVSAYPPGYVVRHSTGATLT
jgi:magnesium-protoporphyrin IX monomethyl ester (oxidative) cyclase